MAKEVKLLFLFMVSLACYASYNAEVLKSNSGDVSLSINIPSLALSDLLSGHKHTETRENIKGASNETTSAASSEEKDEKSTASAKESKDIGKSLDLAKLLSSGKPVSIKSTETSTMGEKGNTEKSIKEIAIDTLGDSEAKSNTKGSSEGMTFDEKTISKLVPALKQALLKSDNNEKQNTTSSAEPSAGIEEMKKNPSSGLNDDKTAKALSTGKDLKSKNNEEEPKEAKETSEAKEKEGGAADTPAAESKPAAPASSKKGNSMGNQIALVPVSLPSSVLSQLQNAINGQQGGSAQGGNMSAASGNDTSGLLPALSSLLGGAANAALGNMNNNKTTAEKEMSSEHKNETSTATPAAAAFNNETSSMTNGSTSEMEEKEGSKLKNKKEREGDKSDKYSEKSAAAQNEGNKDEAKAMKKDTPVLVVIPQITNAARDPEKSGFFSKKATSNRIRSGLHKKSKVQKNNKKAHKKSKVHHHKHHHH